MEQQLIDLMEKLNGAIEGAPEVFGYGWDIMVRGQIITSIINIFMCIIALVLGIFLFRIAIKKYRIKRKEDLHKDDILEELGVLMSGIIIAVSIGALAYLVSVLFAPEYHLLERMISKLS